MDTVSPALGASKEEFEKALKRLTERYDEVCQDYDRNLIAKHLELRQERQEHAETRSKVQNLTKKKRALEKTVERLQLENRKLKLKSGVTEDPQRSKRTRSVGSKRLKSTFERDNIPLEPVCAPNSENHNQPTRRGPEQLQSQTHHQAHEILGLSPPLSLKISQLNKLDANAKNAIKVGELQRVELAKKPVDRPKTAAGNRIFTAKDKPELRNACPFCGKVMLKNSLYRHLRNICRGPNPKVPKLGDVEC